MTLSEVPLSKISGMFLKKAKLLSTCPEVLKEFYQQANPVDVEVTMDGNAVRFVPADELETIQSDYSMGKERFVFATCNGDPIYVYDKNDIYLLSWDTQNKR